MTTVRTQNNSLKTNDKLKVTHLFTLVFFLTATIARGQVNDVFVQDTFQCPNAVYDLLYPDPGNVVVFPQNKVDFNQLDFRQPLFIDANSNTLFFSVHKYNFDYNFGIDLTCPDCVTDSTLLKQYKYFMIYFSNKQRITYDGKFILIDNFKTNETQKIPFPFPKESRVIFSPDADYLFTVNNYYLYRYSIKTNKLDSILYTIDKATVGNCSKTGKILIPYKTVNDTTYLLALFDKNLKIIDSIALPVYNPHLLPFFTIEFNPLDDNEFYFSCPSGIYKVNFKTKQRTLIKESCRYKSIHNFTISADGKCIVAEVAIKHYISDKSSNSFSRLLYIDLADNSSKLINPNRH